MSWRCSACSGTNPDANGFCGRCGANRGVPGAAGSRAGAYAVEETVTAVVADPTRGFVVSDAAVTSDPGGRTLRTDRRLVTSLFADISGFSELTGRLDAEQLLEIIDPVVSALSNVVGRYGGVVEKFAGDAVLALFGAPVAHDDDAARALRAALDMHDELDSLLLALAPSAADLRLHIGINSGHGIGRLVGSEVRLDYGVLGDVVVLAQRLEAAAPVGETYVGETTHELTRKEFEFEPLGELMVKGKSDPVRAWRLIGPRQQHVVAVFSSGAEQMLVGRERELSKITRFAARLGNGRGGAVFVLGEPGVGKTALAEAVHARIDDTGCEWLAARCLSYGGELAYWPFADLFRRLFSLDGVSGADAVQHLREELVALGVEEALPFVGALCGVDARATGWAAQSFQVRLHEAVVAVMQARAAAGAVVLHIDDLHWADGPTLALLRDLLPATRDTSLMVLATGRPEAAGIFSDLHARAPESSVRIELDPLPDEALRELAAGILEGTPSAGLVTALVERTRGNPFFVEEVTRSLAERGKLIERNGEWHTAPDWDGEQVPLTVEGVLAARIDALPDRERDALDVLAVIGRRADRKLALAISGGIEEVVPTLVAGGLLDEPDGPGASSVSFHHPLTQQVVYSRMLRRQRINLHRRVGEAAESLYGADDASIDLFARHFYLGEDADKAYVYLVRAADRAERLFANDQALSHIHKALGLTGKASDAEDQRDELLLRCAHLEEVRGRYAEALSLYREVFNATADFRAGLGQASTLRKQGDYEQCLTIVRQLRAARPNLTPRETGALALEEGWVLGLTGQVQPAVDVLQSGLASVTGQDDQLEGQVLLILARTEALSEAFGDGLAHAERARLLLERSEDLPRLAMALRVLGGAQHDAAGDDRDAIEKARSTLEQALALARRVGNAEEQAAALINLGYVLSKLGETEAALQADRDALVAFESVGIKAGVACSYCNLAEKLHDSGRPEEAKAAALNGLAVAEEINNPYWITGALIGLAEAELELDNVKEAAAACERAAESALTHGLSQRTRAALEIAVQAYERLGDADRAQALRRRAAALDER
jgi:adenylate cyclase